MAPLKSQGLAGQRLLAMVTAACEILREGCPQAGPEQLHRLQKADTAQGLDSIRAMASMGALRILSEGIRKARTRNPETIEDHKGLQVRAYAVKLEGLPVSTENVFHNYDESVADGFKNTVQARLVSARQQFERTNRSTLDPVSISESAMDEFDRRWSSPEGRMAMVPGKELLSAWNVHLQQAYHIALSPAAVVDSFLRDEICPEVVALLQKLDQLRATDMPEQSSLEFAKSAEN